MSFGKSFTLALSNIVYDKMRSLLTMLGIIVGVAAVIILISLMNGLTGMITDKFEDLGTTTLTVTVTARGGNRVVKEEKMYELRDEHPELFQYITPSVTLSGNLKTPGNVDAVTATSTGVNEEYADIKELNVTQGRFLTYMDMQNCNKVCVIGTYVQKELFGMNGSPVGQTVKINGSPYTVVGVLEEKNDSKSGGADAVCYVPYTTAQRVSGNTNITSYTLTAASDEVVASAKEVLEAKLLELLGDDDYFKVISMQEMIDTLTEMMDTMSIILVCIAGISLLVGGIGIMNIMLVSVTERTREIGIRKSLGAKKRTILTQFVIEAGTVSGIGGIIGIVLGSVVALLAGKLLGLNATPSVGAIFLAFGVSVGIGILFGYLPARNAARLNPIDALRHD